MSSRTTRVFCKTIRPDGMSASSSYFPRFTPGTSYEDAVRRASGSIEKRLAKSPSLSAKFKLSDFHFEPAPIQPSKFKVGDQIIRARWSKDQPVVWKKGEKPKMYKVFEVPSDPMMNGSICYDVDSICGLGMAFWSSEDDFALATK